MSRKDSVWFIKQVVPVAVLVFAFVGCTPHKVDPTAAMPVTFKPQEMADALHAVIAADREVYAVGSDTETFEVQPAPDPAPDPGPTGNPQPVHTALLIERGVYIMESLDLEELARQRRYEFLFVALPVKIRGATGSMVDPVAVV